ncbi:MAG: GNAT family N-acetyltransferase [Candidatus Aenigmatarchaeota archaeon]
MSLNISGVRNYLEKKYLGARVRIYETRNASGNDFSNAMDIYKKSFPPEELAPPEEIAHRIKSDPNYHLFVSKKGCDVIGMAIVKTFPNFVFGNYLATIPEYRNKDLGSKFIKFFKKRFRSRLKNSLGFIGEVDTEEGVPKNLVDSARRRQNYYRRRFGAKSMEKINYVQPSYSNGEPVKMDLMIFFQKKEKNLKAEDVRSVIKTLYTEIYHKKPDDPLIRSLENITGEVKLR